MSLERNAAVEEMRPVNRRSLSDEIVEQIVDLISKDVLKPGARLPGERDLCKRFGVGRTSLREALRSLSVMGILEGRVGEGTFVANDSDRYLEKTLQWSLLLDPKRVKDLVETRLVLESQNASLAAQRATRENLSMVAQNIEGMEDLLERPDQFLECDLEFHLLIARATQNTILYSLLSMTRGYLHEWIKGMLARPMSEVTRRTRLSLEEHHTIFQAIGSGDSERAQQAMKGHILSSSADLPSKASDEDRAGPVRR